MKLSDRNVSDKRTALPLANTCFLKSGSSQKPFGAEFNEEIKWCFLRGNWLERLCELVLYCRVFSSLLKYSEHTITFIVMSICSVKQKEIYHPNWCLIYVLFCGFSNHLFLVYNFPNMCSSIHCKYAKRSNYGLYWALLWHVTCSQCVAQVLSSVSKMNLWMSGAYNSSL